jgi:hypothetical protein
MPEALRVEGKNYKLLEGWGGVGRGGEGGELSSKVTLRLDRNCIIIWSRVLYRHLGPGIERFSPTVICIF